MQRNISIQFTGRSAAILLAAAALVWLIANFSTLLVILFLAILLAVAITPLVERLAMYMPRAVAILIVYVVLLAVVGAAVGLLVPVLVTEIKELGRNLPKLTRQALALPEHVLAPLSLPLGGTSLFSEIGTRLGALAGNASALVLSLGATFTTVLIDSFLMLVTAFFLTADAQFAPHFIARFFPPRYRPMASELAHEMGGRLGHWVRAQVLVGICFGTMFGLGLLLLGVPYAFSLGVAGAILELIPYVGGAIVTMIAMLVALSISPWLPLGVLGLELLIANIESHVIYPKLVGDIVGLHPLVIIIALFIGAEARGVLGALLAVPVAVVIQVLFERFYRFDEAVEAQRTMMGSADAAGTRSNGDVRPPLLPDSQKH
jgi:predicted PurR-regulated permease PerM